MATQQKFNKILYRFFLITIVCLSFLVGKTFAAGIFSFSIGGGAIYEESQVSESYSYEEGQHNDYDYDYDDYDYDDYDYDDYDDYDYDDYDYDDYDDYYGTYYEYRNREELVFGEEYIEIDVSYAHTLFSTSNNLLKLRLGVLFGVRMPEAALLHVNNHLEFIGALQYPMGVILGAQLSIFRLRIIPGVIAGFNESGTLITYPHLMMSAAVTLSIFTVKLRVGQTYLENNTSEYTATALLELTFGS